MRDLKELSVNRVYTALTVRVIPLFLIILYRLSIYIPLYGPNSLPCCTDDTTTSLLVFCRNPIPRHYCMIGRRGWFLPSCNYSPDWPPCGLLCTCSRDLSLPWYVFNCRTLCEEHSAVTAVPNRSSVPVVPSTPAKVQEIEEIKEIKASSLLQARATLTQLTAAVFLTSAAPTTHSRVLMALSRIPHLQTTQNISAPPVTPVTS